MSSPPDDKGALIIIARAVRTRGLKGEIVADLLTDFPERFDDVAELIVVPGHSGAPQTLTLENYWFQNDRVILKFAGYDTVEQAQAIVGLDLAVPESERVSLAEDEFYDWELEGCAVYMKKSGDAVGTVREVMRTGGVALLVVSDEHRVEHLIPMAKDIVAEIDLEAKKIIIDPPDGLLDL
jgi:16S rRNA processing protein RimM